MAFLAFFTADILNSYAIHFASSQIFMEFFVNAVEFISISAGIREINLGRTMAVDTPAHAHICKLFHLVHFLDRTMAGLALYFTGTDMLCLADEYVVGKILHLCQFYRVCVLSVLPAGYRP